VSKKYTAFSVTFCFVSSLSLHSCRIDLRYNLRVFTRIRNEILDLCIITRCSANVSVEHAAFCVQDMRSTVSMKATRFSGSLLTSYQTTRCHNPEDLNLRKFYHEHGGNMFMETLASNCRSHGAINQKATV
jgi:hypothetical protein